MLPRILEVVPPSSLTSPLPTSTGGTSADGNTDTATPNKPSFFANEVLMKPSMGASSLLTADAEKRLSVPLGVNMSGSTPVAGPLTTCAPGGVPVSAATHAVRRAAGSLSRATIMGAKRIVSDTDAHLASAAETAMNFFPGAALSRPSQTSTPKTPANDNTSTSSETTSSPSIDPSPYPPSHTRNTTPLPVSISTTTLSSKSKLGFTGIGSDSGIIKRTNARSRVSLDGEFTVFCEDYSVPLFDNSGYLPMDRECTRTVFAKGAEAAKGAILLVPGFASNRQMFHLGGGLGKSGPSFSEFLAQRDYDVFSVDLRGTAESLALGAKRPASMKEYVEVDIPSALSTIKRIGGYSKVYLIGHSMGGALSCAVAGLYPDDVAGVIHLAGLYHYTLPGLSEAIDLYKAFCPGPIKALVRGSTELAVRSVSAVVSPIVHGVSYVIGGNAAGDYRTQRPALPPPPRLNGLSPATPLPPPKQPAILEYARQFLTHLKRQPIPVRSWISSLIFLRRFVPGRVEKAIMNAVYPSPWVPNSVEDPWGLMKASVESPSVGIYLSIAQMAIHHEFYNDWVSNSTDLRAEAAEGEILAGDQAVGKDGDESSQLKLPPAPSTTRTSSTASTTSCSSTGSQPKRRAKSADASSSSSSNSDSKQSESAAHMNELTPYLEKFEKLAHLPLFFCYANADGVIRMKDSLIGYERSGSLWKEVIRYEDGDVLKSAPVGVSEVGGAKAPGAAPAAKKFYTGAGDEPLTDKQDIGNTAEDTQRLRGTIVGGLKESMEDAVHVLLTGDDPVVHRSPNVSANPTPLASPSVEHMATIDPMQQHSGQPSMKHRGGHSHSHAHGHSHKLSAHSSLSHHNTSAGKAVGSMPQPASYAAVASAADAPEGHAEAEPAGPATSLLPPEELCGAYKMRASPSNLSLASTNSTGSNQERTRTTSGSKKGTVRFSPRVVEPSAGAHISWAGAPFPITGSAIPTSDTHPPLPTPTKPNADITPKNPSEARSPPPIDLERPRPPLKSFSSTSLFTLPLKPRSHHHHPRPAIPSSFTRASSELSHSRAASANPSSSNRKPATPLPSGQSPLATSSSEFPPPPSMTPTASGSGTKPTFPMSYSIDPGTSYGHIDILGGVHAERMWERIGEWLDLTSGREREWRFWRRYSAK
ncbi:uncharacterized protein EV422DRAFT_48298 [Fimicolochytrium jonesii]|uniref:uncharacterized protein n=1 Tax=Fimicolochytrium jonesii TaxID=1396493 RepID=UPI0022FE5F02|nr:uncharacterized protein EV422DRAFT_48298 [Fimicolochytrium jonesii]KAI8820984.1 hypothetical protein EV422DRAFT_48298 [Fimicolochytrium jonesii]